MNHEYKVGDAVRYVGERREHFAKRGKLIKCGGSKEFDVNCEGQPHFKPHEWQLIVKKRIIIC